jgi:hypothetical protein
MTAPRKVPFRAGHIPGALAPAVVAPELFTGPYTLLADVSEWEPDIADALYLQWSKAIVIRAAYGDQHDDRAWYGGRRRDVLHYQGARFVGIYQYLVAGQDGAAQADAMHRLVGALRPGEILCPDFEEGQHAMLTAWYNRMILLYGTGIRPYLWTYTGLNFGEVNGALPVEWVAAYGQAEPVTTHKLWQFTSSFPVPGVGSADCSVFHGTIGELAALAYQKPQAQPPPAPKPKFGKPTNVTVRAGDTNVEVLTADAPAGMTPGHFEVSVYTGSFPSAATLVDSYPRFMGMAPKSFGNLGGFAPGTHMTCRVVAVDADGTRSAYADVHFEMP